MRLRKSTATVIGPIPPGTGVNNDAFFAHEGSASPFNTPPSSEVPASKIMTCSRIWSGVISPGCPAPKISICACSMRSRVLVDYLSITST